MNRREFLIKLARGGGAFFSATKLPLISFITSSGCTHFDRLIFGEQQDLTHEVVILGGGVSGLVAAYALKKKRVPFTLFEANSRVGGRVLTLKNWGDENFPLELGAEWYSKEHRSLFKLSKELKLDLTEVPLTAFLGEKAQTKRADWGKLLSHWKKRLHRIQTKGIGPDPKISTAEQILPFLLPSKEGQNFSFSSHFFRWVLERYFQRRWGSDLDQISGDFFIHHLLQSVEVSSLLGMTDWNWRFRGGSQNLVQSLYDRTCGVLPGKNIRTLHQLIRLEEKNQIFRLTFSSPQGDQVFFTKRVICTLPWPAFVEVQGWDKISFSRETKASISSAQYGSLSKAGFFFKHKSNHLLWKEGIHLLGDNLPLQTAWSYEEPNVFSWIKKRAQKEDLLPGVLTALWGGRAGAAGGPQLESQLETAPELGLGQLGQYGHLFHLQNWSTLKLFHGGVRKWGPGETFTPEDLTRLARGHCQNRWFFAGDQVSDSFPGTLNGAVETGLLAAENTLRSMQYV